MLADPLLSALLRDALPKLADAGLLRLYRCRFAGEIIAVLFAMHREGRACYCLSGFDPAHRALSPGTVLIGTAIEQAAQEGSAEFDFLRGQEPYRHDWGATDRRRFRRTLVRSA